MKTVLILFILCPVLIFSQKYINIGSSKIDVKRVQGEPTSIQNFEALNMEIWGYGENGIATVTFKNGKIESYNNYDKVLKIGSNKKESKSSIGEKDFWERESQREKQGYVYTPKSEDAYGTDISGLYGGGKFESKSIPEEYEEMANARGLSPFSLPDEYILKEMQSEYEKEKYLKWLYIGLAITALIFSINFIRKLLK